MFNHKGALNTSVLPGSVCQPLAKCPTKKAQVPKVKLRPELCVWCVQCLSYFPLGGHTLSLILNRVTSLVEPGLSFCLLYFCFASGCLRVLVMRRDIIGHMQSQTL